MLEGIQAANEDQKAGIEIVARRFAGAGPPDRRPMPARKVSIVAGKILENDDYDFGFNAQTGEYGDHVAQGIIDPAKVVRTALQDAASVAGLLITTEAMIAEKPKKESGGMPQMPGGGMDY